MQTKKFARPHSSPPEPPISPKPHLNLDYWFVSIYVCPLRQKICEKNSKIGFREGWKNSNHLSAFNTRFFYFFFPFLPFSFGHLLNQQPWSVKGALLIRLSPALCRDLIKEASVTQVYLSRFVNKTVCWEPRRFGKDESHISGVNNKRQKPWMRALRSLESETFSFRSVWRWWGAFS